MKFYLAARYSRHPEMQGVRDVLEAFGHHVTSRWIDQHGGTELESRTAEQLNTDWESCTIFADHDIEDMNAAEAIIFFSSLGDPGKGGRFVEWGYALAQNKLMILVGPRENVFHTLPQIRHYPDWPRLVMDLGTDLIINTQNGILDLQTGDMETRCPRCWRILANANVNCNVDQVRLAVTSSGEPVAPREIHGWCGVYGDY